MIFRNLVIFTVWGVPVPHSRARGHAIWKAVFINSQSAVLRLRVRRWALTRSSRRRTRHTLEEETRNDRKSRLAILNFCMPDLAFFCGLTSGNYLKWFSVFPTNLVHIIFNIWLNIGEKIDSNKILQYSADSDSENFTEFWPNKCIPLEKFSLERCKRWNPIGKQCGKKSHTTKKCVKTRSA